MNLKLNEIIWEITSKCDKGCKYCGSKNILNSDIEDYDKTIQIAEMIAKYPPKSVNISGGEPGCMDVNVLYKCIEILTDAKIEVKIITNGVFFNNNNALLNKVDLVGYSVNTLEDIEIAKKHYLKTIDNNYFKTKVVIITNFGKHNIWDFDKIAEFAKEYSAGWQVQLTSGHDLNLPQDGIQQLWDKLEKCSTSYVLADDLQKTHECQAGLQNCGITFDGYVMPCLSMRSWAKDEDIWDDKEKYNLFNYIPTVMPGMEAKDVKSSLQIIWENEFKHRRFCDNCKCCRDDFDYPLVTNIKIIPDTGETLPHPDIWNPIIDPNDMPVVMYGVSLPYVYPDNNGNVLS